MTKNWSQRALGRAGEQLAAADGNRASLSLAACNWVNVLRCKEEANRPSLSVLGSGCKQQAFIRLGVAACYVNVKHGHRISSEFFLQIFLSEAASPSNSHGEPRPQVRKKNLLSSAEPKLSQRQKNRTAKAVDKLQASELQACFLRQSKA